MLYLFASSKHVNNYCFTFAVGRTLQSSQPKQFSVDWQTSSLMGLVNTFRFDNEYDSTIPVLADEVMVDFRVLASEVSDLNNIAISTFLHCMYLVCLLLTRSIT